MIISINSENGFDKSQYLFRIKAVNNVGIEWIFLN